jgi:hypothetical protein
MGTEWDPLTDEEAQIQLTLSEQIERLEAQLSDALFREAVAAALAALLINTGDLGHLRNWRGDHQTRRVPGSVLGLSALSIEVGDRVVTYGDLLALADRLERE